MTQGAEHALAGALTNDEVSLTDEVYMMSRVRSFKSEWLPELAAQT